MTTTIVDGVTKDGSAKFIYSVGLAEFSRPELVLILDRSADTSVSSGIPGLMSTLIGRAIASAQAGNQVDNDETVRVEWCGLHCRLHTVEGHPNFPMPRFMARYGFEPTILTQVEVLPRADA